MNTNRFIDKTQRTNTANNCNQTHTHVQFVFGGVFLEESAKVSVLFLHKLFVFHHSMSFVTESNRFAIWTRIDSHINFYVSIKWIHHSVFSLVFAKFFSASKLCIFLSIVWYFFHSIFVINKHQQTSTCYFVFIGQEWNNMQQFMNKKNCFKQYD